MNTESQLVPIAASQSQSIAQIYDDMYNHGIDNNPTLYWLVYFAGRGMEVMIWNLLGDLFHMATTPKGKLLLKAVVATAVGITY
jgi:hypothetical protein